MRKLPLIILLIVLTSVHVFLLGRVTEGFKLLPKEEEDSAFMMPTPILKIAALDFHSIASDYLFLHALVFLGTTDERTERPRVKPWEWKWLYSVVDASASLDPYFYDPYYFAQAQFTWGPMMIQETNTLLERGSHARDWDPMLPFFIGFNYFYFLHDDESAGVYLMEAAKKPGADPMYAGLAAKLAYKSNRTEIAIAFLEEMAKKTDDEALKKTYEVRIEALRDILSLENAVAVFKKKFGRVPQHLDDLVKKGIIEEMPKDPYGGEYFVDSQGRVKTTSESNLLPHRKEQQLLFPAPSLLMPDIQQR